MKLRTLKEHNNFYIIPTFRIFWEKSYDIKPVWLYFSIEFVWLNKTISLDIIEE